MPSTIVELILLSFHLTAFASPIAKRQAPSFVFDGDAPFSVDSTTLASVLSCPNGIPTAASPPVLLVHGTGSTGPETWGDGYVPALKANAYTACYITLPGRAMGDMQVSSEYVAYNLHYLSFLSGLPTSVISHSQGGPNVQWALQFWPSTRSVTQAFVALSPDLSGIDLFSSALSTVCIGDLCQASLWQQSAGSNYYAALHSGDFREQVPTTIVWSKTDEVVTPAKSNAQLPSAKILAVQDLCPGRITGHVSMTIDAAGFVIALDALKHSGTASLIRVLPKALTACFRINAPKTNIDVASQLEAALNTLIQGFILGEPRVTSEPAVMAYASL